MSYLTGHNGLEGESYCQYFTADGDSGALSHLCEIVQLLSGRAASARTQSCAVPTAPGHPSKAGRLGRVGATVLL